MGIPQYFIAVVSRLNSEHHVLFHRCCRLNSENPGIVYRCCRFNSERPVISHRLNCLLNSNILCNISSPLSFKL